MRRRATKLTKDALLDRYGCGLGCRPGAFGPGEFDSLAVHDWITMMKKETKKKRFPLA